MEVRKSASVFPDLVPPCGGAAAEPKNRAAVQRDVDPVPAIAFALGVAVAIAGLVLKAHGLPL